MMRLKKLRQERGLSQEKIANHLGITRQAYSNYENGRREPDFTTVNILADFYDVSVDYLIGHDDRRIQSCEPKDRQEKNLLYEKLESLSPEGRLKAEEYIEMLKVFESVKSAE